MEEFTETERINMLRYLLKDDEKKAIRRSLQMLSFSYIVGGRELIGHDRDKKARSTLLHIAGPV